MICKPCADAGDLHSWRSERIHCGCDDLHAQCAKTDAAACTCQHRCEVPLSTIRVG